MPTADLTYDAAPADRAAATPAASLSGPPRLILRLEGAVVLAGATAAYAGTARDWPLFALLFLVPDLSMLGYLAGPKVGAAAYNVGHSYLGPALLAALGLAFAVPLAVSVALVWIAHIGFDRMLGYGLKYPTAFGHTHLGRVGKAAHR